MSDTMLKLILFFIFFRDTKEENELLLERYYELDKEARYEGEF